ncbi:hypothetical protein [Paraburkholderia sp. ZP32-5]|uniref:hypothetical protein n=1 Tax=Paraburkholderia sp. ZP32-5 TaxID=2883245 RepID=UPI001F1EC667|nr:hypothetical protein [Paraburkholderia sp. ZP32-5]
MNALVARSGSMALAAPQTKDTQRPRKTKRETHFIRCHDAALRTAAMCIRMFEAHAADRIDPDIGGNINSDTKRSPKP